MRQIIHFDIDAFYASVEQLDHPEYRHKPIIVGGDSDRSVVATCSYEARKFGVRSAMSAVVAKRRCPDGIFVYPRMQRYQEVSRKIFQYIESINCDLQKVSIDEGYLDITPLKIEPKQFAKQLKEAVFALTGLTISVGISYNKFLAKLASDWNKPDGIFEIRPSDVPAILLPLPIIKIHGLGKKSCEKLNRIGIFTIADLYQYPLDAVGQIIGETFAKEIIDRIHGIDNRPVEVTQERKSYGKETTLDEDTMDRSLLDDILKRYLERIIAALSERQLMAKTITIKVKYHDFEQFTRSHSLERATINAKMLFEAYEILFQQTQFEKPVRLIGITLSNLEEIGFKQFNILEEIE
ncbi:MAG: polymerase [Clostridiales bacterium]|jgi:DNA polymerase-4|nr:polymerase [Clostridiales bacterium]MDN5299232.1 polymerase [Clostridiales bacterium]